MCAAKRFSLVLLAFFAGLIPAQALCAEDPAPVPSDIPSREFNLLTFGAVADGKTTNTAAFSKACAAVAAVGGGRLIVPPGTYLTGPITLTSRTELHLEKGATLQFPANVAGYGLPPQPTDKQLKTLQKRVPALIQGQNLHDIAITGPGVIDGGGSAWWTLTAVAEDGSIHDRGSARPKLIALTNVQRLRIDGVTLENSPRWTLMLDRCGDCLIDGLHISAPPDSPNTDGIDPNGCQSVIIRNCTLDVGDDNIAIKAIDAPAHHILIEDCRCLHGRGISIGSETYKGIHDVTVRNCSFDGTAHGIHIKSARDRGNQLYNFDFSNITMSNVAMPLMINLYYEDKLAQMERTTKPVTGTTPFLHDVRITSLTATGADDAGEIIGLPESPVVRIDLADVKISAVTGLIVTDARSVLFKNVDIHAANGDPIISSHADIQH